MPYNDAKSEPIMQKITEGIRRLCTVKATFPLGDPNLKLVHTNSFVFCPIVRDDATLKNFEAISTLLQHTYTRFTHYEKDKWYVEAVTITNNKNKYEMELTLNPLASPLKSYQKDFNKFKQDYLKAKEQADKAAEKNNTNTTKTATVKAVKKTTTKKKTTGSTSMDKAVDKAIKGKTTALSKAKAIDKAFKNHVIYKLYSDAQKTRTGKKSFESAWKKNHLNCADGANLLCAMFIYAGITATILHIPKGGASWAGHYIVRVKINGKYYYTDNSANTGHHTSKPFGKVWNGRTKHDKNMGTLITI